MVHTDCGTDIIFQVVTAALLLSLCPAIAANDGSVGQGGGSSVPFEVSLALGTWCCGGVGGLLAGVSSFDFQTTDF